MTTIATALLPLLFVAAVFGLSARQSFRATTSRAIRTGDEVRIELTNREVVEGQVTNHSQAKVVIDKRLTIFHRDVASVELAVWEETWAGYFFRRLMGSHTECPPERTCESSKRAECEPSVAPGRAH